MNQSVMFPSEQWFRELARQMQTEKYKDQYRGLGAIDCTMVVQVDDPQGPDLIEVQFKSYEVRSIRQLNSLDEADPEHFRIEGPYEAWQEMIENIMENGEPDLEHTLNFLTFPDDPMVVDGPDQLQTDTFYRYNQSLQLFFNGAAEVATRFA
ncbi:MAG: hypothetical protein R3E82_21635 [Pseudomonadales bacterium]